MSTVRIVARSLQMRFSFKILTSCEAYASNNKRHYFEQLQDPSQSSQRQVLMHCYRYGPDLHGGAVLHAGSACSTRRDGRCSSVKGAGVRTFLRDSWNRSSDFCSCLVMGSNGSIEEELRLLVIDTNRTRFDSL